MAVRHYKIVLTTVGPVHVGNGEKLGKKDYFKLDDKSIGVLDVEKFVGRLSSKDLEEYCAFLESKDSRYSLQDFIDDHRQLSDAARKSVLYRVETALAKARRGSLQYFEVSKFVKDSYGCPYVPGSSLKGMLRTALLTYLILKDRSSYADLYDSFLARGNDRSKHFKACKKIERKAFWLEKPDAKDGKVVNDIMHYVSVSDSAPLSTNDLVFVKKYDKFSRNDTGRHKLAMGQISKESGYYEGNELNIYRESIRPGTRIEFTLDVDERIDAYLGGLVLDRDGITSVLEASFEVYKRCFLDYFDYQNDAFESNAGGTSDDGRCRYIYQSGPFAGMRCRNMAVGDTGYCNPHKEYAVPKGKQVACCLGGGVDFDSKTVVNALLGEGRERVDEISRILYAQFPTWLDPSIHSNLQDEISESGFVAIRRGAKRNRSGKVTKGKEDHRHWKDVELGVSPHTLKLGIIGDKKYPMGRCTIEIEEAQ